MKYGIGLIIILVLFIAFVLFSKFNLNESFNITSKENTISIGKVVDIGIGESIYCKNCKVFITYCGIISNSFSISYHSLNFYYPLDTDTINIQGIDLKIKRINPYYIRLEEIKNDRLS